MKILTYCWRSSVFHGFLSTTYSWIETRRTNTRIVSSAIAIPTSTIITVLFVTMVNRKRRVTGSQHAGNYRLRRQRVRRDDVERDGTNVRRLTWNFLDWSRMMLIIEISGVVWQLLTVQHCLSGVMRVWVFTDCVFVSLNANDADDDICSNRNANQYNIYTYKINFTNIRRMTKIIMHNQNW